MLPIHALDADIPMYYNNTWMQSRRWGVVYINTQINDEGKQIIIGTDANRDGHVLRKNELANLWIKTGVYNLSPRFAIYVTRVGMRQWKKSTAPELYHCLYPKSPYELSSEDIWSILTHETVPFFDPKTVLKGMKVKWSRGVDHNIIVERGETGNFVYFQGELITSITNTTIKKSSKVQYDFIKTVFSHLREI